MIIETLNSLNNPNGVNGWQERFQDFYDLVGVNIYNMANTAFNYDLYGKESECIYNKGNDYMYLLMYFSIMYMEQEDYYNETGERLTEAELKEEYDLDCLYTHFFCLNNNFTEEKWESLIDIFYYNPWDFCDDITVTDLQARVPLVHTTDFTVNIDCSPGTYSYTITSTTDCPWSIPELEESGTSSQTINVSIPLNDTGSPITYTYTVIGPNNTIVITIIQAICP